MLQQTQVATVVPYFERWLSIFPTLKSLAEAPKEMIFAIWAGLGYYRRADNLHRGAQQVMREFGGEIPGEVSELLRISGIGPYTAGAIASFAFNRDVPAVDGNVERVLSRLMGIRDDLRSPAAALLLKRHAESLAAAGDARLTSQAMMDLGASVCGRKAACELCPLQAVCRANIEHCADEIPFKSKKLQKHLEYRLALILKTKDDHYLVMRRKNEGLLGGLWVFPMITLYKNLLGEENPEAIQMSVHRSQAASWHAQLAGSATLQPDWSTLRRLNGEICHVFTHIQMHVLLDEVMIDTESSAIDVSNLTTDDSQYDAAEFVTAEALSALGTSTLMKKMIHAVFSQEQRKRRGRTAGGSPLLPF